MDDCILLFGLFCGFIGLDVRLTKEEPFELNKEQNTELKKRYAHSQFWGFPCHAHCIASFWFSPDDLSYIIF